MSYVDLAARALLALVFAAAVYGKLRDWASLPRVAKPVVVLEAVAVPLLILGPLGYPLACGLLVCFSAYIAYSMRRRLALRCNCFGSSRVVLSGRHLVRNGLLLGVAIAGWALSGDGAVVHPAGIAMSVGVAVCLAILVVRLDDIAALLR